MRYLVLHHTEDDRWEMYRETIDGEMLLCRGYYNSLNELLLKEREGSLSYMEGGRRGSFDTVLNHARIDVNVFPIDEIKMNLLLL
jgi:hypothetical protein